jgi:hypothetical protein
MKGGTQESCRKAAEEQKSTMLLFIATLNSGPAILA